MFAVHIDIFPINELDFNSNSGTFSGAAGFVQNSLAEITPDVAVHPALPIKFYNWLGSVVSQYSNRCA
jgi:hypothetical protein